jgi:AraC-like DNA-binding protein
MQLAKSQLLAGDSSLSEIATNVGYASASAFSYALKHVVGCTPASYRSASAKQRVRQSNTNPYVRHEVDSTIVQHELIMK